MARYQWKSLSTLQVGRYAEYFVKMDLTMYGYEVFSSEVDDRGIDFIARGGGGFLEIQVKASRNLSYVFVRKEDFPLTPDRLIALVLLEDGKEPELYLIPMTAWAEPNRLFVSRDYDGLKSKPEWGLNLSLTNLPLLEPYRLEQFVALA